MRGFGRDLQKQRPAQLVLIGQLGALASVLGAGSSGTRVSHLPKARLGSWAPPATASSCRTPEEVRWRRARDCAATWGLAVRLTGELFGLDDRAPAQFWKTRALAGPAVC